MIRNVITLRVVTSVAANAAQVAPSHVPQGTYTAARLTVVRVRTRLFLFLSILSSLLCSVLFVSHIDDRDVGNIRNYYYNWENTCQM